MSWSLLYIDAVLQERDRVGFDYDRWRMVSLVYIGYQLWWDIVVWLMNNFIKLNDFVGKTVIPFCRYVLV